MKKFIIPAILTVLMLLSLPLFAQPLPPDDTRIPIDGGLFTLLLLASGGAMAYRKMQGKKNTD